jgi:hypothetical protein
MVNRMAQSKARMRTFDNEWIFEAFEKEPSFFTKRIFSGLAAYLFGRMMLVLVEPNRTGTRNWHGVLICTDNARQPAILEQFPEFAPHDILKKWLYIDSRHEQFEPAMEQVAKAVAGNDRRFGILPHPKKERVVRNSRPAVTPAGPRSARGNRP